MPTAKALLMLSLAGVAGCSSLISPPPSPPAWPSLTVIQMRDGGVCLPPEDAQRLAEYRAELEALR